MIITKIIVTCSELLVLEQIGACDNDYDSSNITNTAKCNIWEENQRYLDIDRCQSTDISTDTNRENHKKKQTAKDEKFIRFVGTGIG